MSANTEITKTEFFATVGVLNVYPRVDVASLKTRFFTSCWVTINRTVLGKTITDSWGVEPTRFFVKATKTTPPSSGDHTT